MSDATVTPSSTDLNAIEEQPARPRANTDRRGKPRIGRVAAWAVLIVIMLASLFPVYWALRTAFSTNNAIIEDNTNPLPPEFTWFNFERVFTDQETLSQEARIDFQQRVAEVGGNDVNFKIREPLITSLTVSTLITVGQVFFCAMSAYAFARLKFKGREVVFTIFLSALMIPPIFALIPNILLIREKEIDLWAFQVSLGWLPWGDEQGGWTSTIPGLVAPFILMTPFAIFFLRQFFIGISKEVEEAAVLDGAGHARRFFQIILPMAAAPIFTLALITYVNSWNEFLWPFQAARNLPTITVALNDFRAQTPGTTRPDWTGLMTGTFIAGAPILILFALLGRKVVDSIQFSGIK
ncbi:MAG: carbohydrate ABC transporter permease [Actinomycetota bacterium]